MRALVCGALLVAAELAAGRSAVAANEAKNVLVLFSNARLLPANIEVDTGIRETLRTSADRPVMLFDEFLDEPRFAGPAFERSVMAYLRDKYASRPPQVVVVAGNEALQFVLRNRAALFPSVPLVHIAVSRLFLRSLPARPADVVGVPLDLNFSATIAQALRWHPQARHLVVVTGAGARDRDFENELRDEIERSKPRAKVEFLVGLPSAAVLKRLGELGSDAVVFTTGYFQDGEGRDTAPRESVRAMAAVSLAPLYVPFNTMLGTGAVGGYMLSFEAIGQQAGQTASALLDGAAPGSLRPAYVPPVLHVDWRQVRRWGIDADAIPADAIVHFKSPTLLEAYRKEAMSAAAVFLIQAGLIGWLLIERRRRRRAEGTVGEQRFQLAHALRLQIAAELTGSIAHEINQPLGAILSNADAADLILDSGADRREEVRGILADIRRDDLRASKVIERVRALLAKHVVEPQAMQVDGLLRDVESLLITEARRRGVSLDIRPPGQAMTVFGDRIQVQQVLINLVLNGMDAVADMPESRRTVTLSAESVPGGVAIRVRDCGKGIEPEQLSKLFEPFFTTKASGMGLGLAISRSIVEAHGGRIWAENVRDEGAVFQVELRSSGGPGVSRPEKT